MTKFFFKFKNPYFGPFSQFWGQKKFFQKIRLSCTTTRVFPRKYPDRSREGRMDRPYFIRFFIVGTPPPPFIKGTGVSNFKREGSNFSHKKAGVGKRGALFWKRKISLIFMLTNQFQSYLSLSISMSIICVSQEETCFTESNQQIYDFHKWIIFEKTCGK